MKQKMCEKETAIALRKAGKTYNEILEVVPVAKSTLSLWLRDVGLSQVQKQRVTAKKRAAQIKGGARKREIRLAETALINKECKKDIASLSERELFLIGVALYWAEGAKKDGDRPGVPIDFGNSDPAMVKLFVVWLQQVLEVPEEDIALRLHLHQNHQQREREIKSIWLKSLQLPADCFRKTIYKKHNPKTVRYKTDQSYIGLVSVRVKKSTKLNRRILGWIYAIIATQK